MSENAAAQQLSRNRGGRAGGGAALHALRSQGQGDAEDVTKASECKAVDVYAHLPFILL